MHSESSDCLACFDNQHSFVEDFNSLMMRHIQMFDVDAKEASQQ